MKNVGKLNIFISAQWKLTFWYTLMFFAIFWVFSSAIYWWMARELGDSYISQIRLYKNPDMVGWPEVFQESHTRVLTVAGELALSKLRRILVILDLILAVFIPVGAWVLANWTLRPLEKAHEKQKQFVSDASHELRTPLSIISGEIEVSLQKKRSALIYQRVLVSAKEEVDRLAMMVKQLLFLARSESNEFQKESIDITDTVSSVVASLTSKARKKRQKIKFIPDTEPSQINGNGALITQLFYNLIDNSLNYTPTGGQVEIILKNRKSWVRTLISDNGPGIDKGEQSKVFERFYRVDNARRQQKGYGLGLSIAKRIVELHRGQIEVVSELGSGTTFVVMLPVK